MTAPIDRASWLAERRQAVERSYSDDAATYDDDYDPVTPTHRRFVERLVETTPPGGTVLDIPCGTGPYFDLVIGSGRRVVGADQSAGMLEAARTRHPDVRLELVGLQEVDLGSTFDAVMTIDSMEHVPPEEWPLVVGNLRSVLLPGGHLYLTVEEIDDGEVAAAFDDLTSRGLPAVRGEHDGEQAGGYHFYPDRGRVVGWLAAAGLTVVDEADEALDGYAYWHVLARLSTSRRVRSRS
jgi:SAM-dependent methyltransferase